MDIPTFDTKKELFDFLITNKDKIIASKKAVIKHGASVPFDLVMPGKAQVVKSIAKADNLVEEVAVKAIINTTNILDSHGDVHLPGIWNKSLKENRYVMHLQEHEMKFDHIISEGEDLKVSTKKYTWKELGFKFEGETEALVFDSVVKRSNNALMFDRYKNSKVKNHSVGMQYVKLMLAINSDDYPTEKEIWDKYYPEIANKEAADAAGYFWAVKEAKVIEGSAVPIGSNYATPTLEPDDSTPKNNQIEPSMDTQEFKEIFKNNLKNLLR